MRAVIKQHGRSELPVSVIEQRTALWRQLAKFRSLQATYQPELTTITAPPDDDVVETALHLPSSLPSEVRENSSSKLVQMEKELRLGQCEDALSTLRLNLHSKSRMLKDKFVNVRHQGPNTRSRELLDRVSARILASADKYRAAHSALDTLDPDPKASWRNELLVLEVKDVRGMAEPKPLDHLDFERANAAQARILLPGGVFPEGSQTILWIWRGVPTGSEDVTGFNEGFSVFHFSPFVRF